MGLQPESTARLANIGYLIEPKSVAIVGASADATRIGGRPINWMLKAGFGGAIYPVNPNRSEIRGLRAYESVLKLPEAPDAAVVAVPAAIVLETMEQLGERGTTCQTMRTPDTTALSHTTRFNRRAASDETLDHPHEGFPAGTAWASVPDEWACPDCAVRDKVDFELIGGSPATTASAAQAVEVGAVTASAATGTDTAVIEKPAVPVSKPAGRTAAVLRATALAPEAVQPEAGRH